MISFHVTPGHLRKLKRHFVKAGYQITTDKPRVKIIQSHGGDTIFSALKYPGAWVCCLDPEFGYEVDHAFNRR